MLQNEEIQLLKEIKMLLQMNKEILTTQEASAYLGVSVESMNRYSSAGIIPYSQPNGKMRYFRKEDLIEFATRNRVEQIRL